MKKSHDLDFAPREDSDEPGSLFVCFIIKGGLHLKLLHAHSED